MEVRWLQRNDEFCVDLCVYVFFSSLGHGKGRKMKGRGREGGRPNKMAKFEGKKTVFKDSDDEGEEEMEEGGEEKKDEPEKTSTEKEGWYSKST